MLMTLARALVFRGARIHGGVRCARRFIVGGDVRASRAQKLCPVPQTATNLLSSDKAEVIAMMRLQ